VVGEQKRKKQNKAIINSIILSNSSQVNKYKVLVSLLDDPDEEVFENVFQKLCEFGPEVIPTLESEWEHNLDERVQERLENLIHTIQFDALVKALENWCNLEKPSLLDGLLIINQFQFPDADNQKLIEQLEVLKKNIWIELNYHLTPLEQIGVFNTIFFKHLLFDSVKENLHEPKNSLLSHVLESKKGNAIGIGLLYLLLAQQLKIPLYGVCLKDYFVLCYVDTSVFNPDSSMVNSQDILFYVNPFNKGALFNRGEIITYLERIKASAKNTYFQPATNKEILAALVHVLFLDFELAGQKEKTDELLLLKQLLAAK
jgi:regulator of sirC expression with transglutaminase-like and TPR domain